MNTADDTMPTVKENYPLPNDEAERARLGLHYHIYRLILDDRLFCAPILAKPQRVLDPHIFESYLSQSPTDQDNFFHPEVGTVEPPEQIKNSLTVGE